MVVLTILTVFCLMQGNFSDPYQDCQKDTFDPLFSPCRSTQESKWAKSESSSAAQRRYCYLPKIWRHSITLQANFPILLAYVAIIGVKFSSFSVWILSWGSCGFYHISCRFERSTWLGHNGLQSFLLHLLSCTSFLLLSQ